MNKYNTKDTMKKFQFFSKEIRICIENQVLLQKIREIKMHNNIFIIVQYIVISKYDLLIHLLHH